MKSLRKILIIRLSSFGDIIQTLPTVDALHGLDYEVHYLTKAEFKHCVEASTSITQIHNWPTKASLPEQIRFINKLFNTHQFHIVYDAHNNQRTFLLRIVSLIQRIKNKTLWISRSKNRFRRVLFFHFKIRSVFKKPLIAAESFVEPLYKIIPGIKIETLRTPPDYLQFYKSLELKTSKASFPVVLAPSAAWPLKRWPIQYFQKIIDLFPETHFIILGGPSDHFALDLNGANVSNLVGKLNWRETGQWIVKAKLLIAADTGVLHWADYMGTKAIGILGPTAFGTPFRQTTKILNLNLSCSPCSKEGNSNCKIKETQKCLRDITPEMVAHHLRSMTKDWDSNAPL